MKEQKGITLVALVITVIVLLIIASISINYGTGAFDNTRLQGFYTKLEIIQKREQERKDRCPGSAEASYTYLYPKKGYDLTVDTHFMTAMECANRIWDGIM